jgi:osmotically-inducible protein OsmY
MVLSIVKSDSEIQAAVLRELKWDTRVEETDVGVEVDKGVVTLTGTVGNYAKRIAAQEAAHRVIGVLDVANDIQVRLPGKGKTDTEIAQAVRHALEWDAHVPHEHIQSTVSAGWVTLEGVVDFWREREEAERAIQRLWSVRGITNCITVRPHDASPEQLHKAIEEALERRAEREARNMHVEVHDGTVKLIGSIHSYREKRAVVGAVAHAPGVRSVEDHLRIDPYI